MRLWVLALLLVGCSDPAEWRPAKGARDYPPAKDAYRVPQEPEGCPAIGFVRAEGGVDPINDIAKTAAMHGGTHYVVVDNIDHPETVSTTTGAANRGLFVATIRTQTEHHRTMWAQVYRCAD